MKIYVVDRAFHLLNNWTEEKIYLWYLHTKKKKNNKNATRFH